MFLSGKSFSVYEVVHVSGVLRSWRHTWRFFTPIGENRQVCSVQQLRSPISGIKVCLSRDFLRSLLRIASKANPSGWAILSHDFLKLPHRRDRRKNRQVCPHQSVAKIACDFRWRSNSPRLAHKIARCVTAFKRLNKPTTKYQRRERRRTC